MKAYLTSEVIFGYVSCTLNKYFRGKFPSLNWSCKNVRRRWKLWEFRSKNVNFFTIILLYERTLKFTIIRLTGGSPNKRLVVKKYVKSDNNSPSFIWGHRVVNVLNRRNFFGKIIKSNRPFKIFNWNPQS